MSYCPKKLPVDWLVRFQYQFVEAGPGIILDETFVPCWNWSGGIWNDTGRGRVKIKGMWFATHRLSWELAISPIPDGLWVLHKCDNGLCLNPDHLFLGTCLDNVKERQQKGRCADIKGLKNPMAKLTDEHVLEIQSKYSTGLYTLQDLAVEYAVAFQTISRTLRREVRRGNVILS